jgi:hypothetical protein
VFAYGRFYEVTAVFVRKRIPADITQWAYKRAYIKPLVGRRGHAPMMKLICAALAAAAVTVAGTAGADPTPAPTPGYQIPGPDGPQFPGAQVYPPQCLRNMLACGFKYDPATGTWQPGTGSS